MIQLFTSLLDADFGKLQAEIDSIEPYVEGFHFDIMDGHFVPNISMGLPVLKKITTKKSFDVHLMVENPLKIIMEMKDLHISMISFHVEAPQVNIEECIRTIHSQNMKAGLAFKPGTSFKKFEKYIQFADYILILTVEPGFGGQSFIESSLERISYIRKKFPNKHIEVDGGINEKTAKKTRSAGANLFVAGTYILHAQDRKSAIQHLQKSILDL